MLSLKPVSTLQMVVKIAALKRAYWASRMDPNGADSTAIY